MSKKSNKIIQLNIRITKDDSNYLEAMMRYGFTKSELIRIGLELVKEKIANDCGAEYQGDEASRVTVLNGL